MIANCGPPEKKGAPPEEQRLVDLTAARSDRQLQLLCAIAGGLSELGDKLDDLRVLNQQQTDLLRRIVRKEHTQ